MIQIRRRTIALALVAFSAFAAVATTSLALTLSRDAGAGAGFTDTPPWIATHAEWLQDNGIADGYDDGTFRPNDNITRGQAAYWFGNYNDAITIVRSEKPASTRQAFSHTASCPANKRAVAGGGSISVTEAFMTDSWPSPDLVPNPSGWTARWETEDDAALLASVTVWAACAPKTLTG